MNLKQFIRPAVLKKEAYSVSGYTCQIKLNQNENPYAFPPDFAAEIQSVIQQSHLNRYPTVFPDVLIHALAKKENISPDMILPGHGSNELIFSSLWAVLSKGDSFLIPAPSFGLYESVAELCEATVHRVVADEETLQLNVDQFLKAINEFQPRIIVLCNPNNPSSQRVSVEDSIRIIKAAPGLVWIDEAYIEFSENESLINRLSEFRNVILLRTFSKAYALAGLRLGYIVSQPELIEEFKKTKVPFTVDDISQSIALKILNHDDWVKSGIQKLKDEKSRFFARLTKVPKVKVFESDTNFFIFKVLDKSHKNVFTQLAESGVLVRDVSSYPSMDGCLRVTIGTPQENDEFIQKLMKILTT